MFSISPQKQYEVIQQYEVLKLTYNDCFGKNLALSL